MNKSYTIFGCAVGYLTLMLNMSNIVEYIDSKNPKNHKNFLEGYKYDVEMIEKRLIICNDVKDVQARHDCNYEYSKDYRKAFDKYANYDAYIQKMKNGIDKKYNN